MDYNKDSFTDILEDVHQQLLEDNLAVIELPARNHLRTFNLTITDDEFTLIMTTEDSMYCSTRKLTHQEPSKVIKPERKPKTFAFRCSGCDAKLLVRKKSPVTTAWGLNSTCGPDVVVDFPKQDEEDLCGKCLSTISGSNTDMNSKWSYDYTPYTKDEIEGVDYSEIDELNRAEAVYQGWSDD